MAKHRRARNGTGTKRRQPGPYFAANTSSVIFAAASSCIAGITCEYVSSVMETVACPSRSETT